MINRTKMNNENTIILGHRGMKGPLENTLPAFMRALRYADGIEFDVRITGDRKLIVHHDGTFISDDGQYTIMKMSLSELRRKHPLGPLIPEVSKVLELPGIFNADVKETSVIEPLLGLVERKKAMDRVVFSSDNPDVVRALLRECPDCRVGLSIVGYSSVAWIPRLKGIYSLHVPIDAISYIGEVLFKALLRTLRKRGLRVYLWNYHMDELFWVPRLIHLVDVLISDDPARLGKVF